MRGFVKLTVCLSVMVAAASAVELGIGVGRDVLYQTDSDTTIQPTAFHAQAGFGLGRSASVQVSAGYAMFRQNTYEVQRELVLLKGLNGARVQATPLFTVATPLSWLSLQGGIGLGGACYWYRREYTLFEEHRTLGTVSLRTLLSVVQTFRLGVDCAFAPQMSMSLYVERPGFRFGLDDASERALLNDEMYLTASREVTLRTGWDMRANTGLGAALRLRL
jgi:hypothetical protein